MLFLLWEAYADWCNKSWNRAMSTQQATSTVLMSGGWGLEDGDLCWPQVLTSTEKDTEECVGIFYFGIVCPLFIQWQSLKEPWLCAGLALPKQKKALFSLSLDPGRQTSEPSECLVKLFLFSWVCGPCQYSVLTLQCVGASAGSLEGLGTEGWPSTCSPWKQYTKSPPKGHHNYRT